MPAPNLHYPDIQRHIAEGARVEMPTDIATLVRDIRSQKFPDVARVGTAGSFFKNPLVSDEVFAAVRAQYPEMPGYAAGAHVKVPLARILDHVLNLRGYALGPVRLFERQPLVLVAEQGATAHDVDALADEVAQKVYDATNIEIEREVQKLS
jgi:UDP-N-acetylmuramate dehydrogenase